MTASILVSPSLLRGLPPWEWLYSSADILCGVVYGVLAATGLPRSSAGGPFPSCTTQQNSMIMVDPHHESCRAAWSDDRTARASHTADGRWVG